jgi:hypothetical protein
MLFFPLPFQFSLLLIFLLLPPLFPQLAYSQLFTFVTAIYAACRNRKLLTFYIRTTSTTLSPIIQHKQHDFNGKMKILHPAAIVGSGDRDKFTLIKFTTLVKIHEKER